MRKLEFIRGGKTWHQVSKRRAEKLYNDNKVIALCASNMRPNGCFNQAIEIRKDHENAFNAFEFDAFEIDAFETICNSYSYYNCNHETGKYIVFYSEEV